MYVGIDQHRKQLTVSVRDESGNVVLRRQVSTEWKKVHAFIGELFERSRTEEGYRAVVEVCGFNDWLLKLLPEQGCGETIVVQPGGASYSPNKPDARWRRERS